MPAPVFQQTIEQRAAIASAQGPSPSAPAPATDDDGFSFADFLDIINPLQHIPVVSTIYRALTHDTIKPVERIAGDTLYGGLWGFVSSVANVVFEKLTGKDFGDTALALLTGDENSGTALAANSTPSDSGPQQVATAAPRKLSALAGTGQTSGLDTAADASVMAYATQLQARNFPSDLSLRALAAYKRAIGLSQPVGALSPII